MKYVIIRDDDVSYFTKPEALEKLYGPLFDERKAVNFSVVPKIAANIKLGFHSLYRTQEKIEYDPCIPPEFRGRNEVYPLNDNRDLVEFIRSLENCEILQHGLTHGLIQGVEEFRIRDEQEIQRRAISGRALLKESFHCQPSFFVPPWDKISSETLNFLKSQYKGLSVGRINPIMLPSRYWGAFIRKTLASRTYMFYESLLMVERVSILNRFINRAGNILNRFNNPNLILNKIKKIMETTDLIILVNHYWEYFFDWSHLDQAFFRGWQQVIEYLLQREDIHFLTHSELYDLLIHEI